MSELFKGFAGVLAWFYDLTHSYGLAVIMLTLAVRIVVTPLTIKGTRSMMAMQQYQPEIKRLQQEFKGDRQRLNEELMKFYRENSINPMGSCLPLLIQAPVFWVLYRVIHGITDFGADGTFNPKYLDHASALYKSLDGSKQMLFLGIDLAKSAAGTLRDGSVVQALPYLVIIAVVTVTSYIQQKQVAGRNPSMSANPMQKNLMRIMPLGFAVFSFSFPAALGLYFVTSNVYQVGQQWYISRALYGVRRGQAPAAAHVVDAASTETPPAAPEAKPAKAPAKQAKPADRQARATRNGKPPTGKGGRSSNPPSGQRQRPPSGRVTEPKRQSSGRTSPKPSDRAAGSSPTPRRGTGSRRVPFGPERPSPADGGGTDPQKKRRR